MAAGKGQRSMVELLLKRGANLEAAGNLRWTPLHTAACFGACGTAEALLDAGGVKGSTEGFPLRSL